VPITRSLTAIIATILIAVAPLAASAQFSVGVGFSVGVPPPALPVYSQPPVPYAGAVWTPGYWAYGPAGYYWVPGTWVAPPSVGLYWTPGYWGAGVGGGYGWNAGYWGASVGFYGGINYGFGYPGVGFYGGAWNGGVYGYNSAYTNVNKTVTNNVYNKTVNCTNCFNKNVSYNGGKGGITATPTSSQIAARKGGIAPTSAQKQQATVAGQDRNQLASVNKGKPSLTSSSKPFTSTNKPNNFAPVTTADKQAAAKIPTHGSNNPSNQALGNKAPTTQNKPANAMQNKAPTTQNKPANTMQNKAPTTQNKPANTMQSKPANEPQNKPVNTMQGQGHHNAMAGQGQHKQPPNNRPQGAMHQGGMGHPQGGTGRPQGGMGRPQGGMGRPQGGGHPPASHPQGGGQKPPAGGGGDKNKPPQR